MPICADCGRDFRGSGERCPICRADVPPLVQVNVATSELPAIQRVALADAVETSPHVPFLVRASGVCPNCSGTFDTASLLRDVDYRMCVHCNQFVTLCGNCSAIHLMASHCENCEEELMGPYLLLTSRAEGIDAALLKPGRKFFYRFGEIVDLWGKQIPTALLEDLALLETESWAAPSVPSLITYALEVCCSVALMSKRGQDPSIGMSDWIQYGIKIIATPLIKLFGDGTQPLCEQRVRLLDNMAIWWGSLPEEETSIAIHRMIDEVIFGTALLQALPDTSNRTFEALAGQSYTKEAISSFNQIMTIYREVARYRQKQVDRLVELEQFDLAASIRKEGHAIESCLR
jgi:hypothetical protein